MKIVNEKVVLQKIKLINKKRLRKTVWIFRLQNNELNCIFIFISKVYCFEQEIKN